MLLFVLGILLLSIFGIVLLVVGGGDPLPPEEDKNSIKS